MRMLPERFGKLGGGRVQWACHCCETSRNELKAVVSGMFAAGCQHICAPVGCDVDCYAVFASRLAPTGECISTCGSEPAREEARPDGAKNLL
ncbi:hypothetical protein F7R05_04735 [Pseudomonas koreensis]|nr:hypothetical protein F7R05_04735 [Pseudomonas koreensis]